MAWGHLGTLMARQTEDIAQCAAEAKNEIGQENTVFLYAFESAYLIS